MIEHGSQSAPARAPRADTTIKVSLTVNGRETTLEGPPMARLLDVLRENLRLTGAKDGCGEGECGACTVLMDDEPVLACLVPLFQCEGRRIVTVEHVAEQPGAAAMLQRFVACGGVQCGACTPGIIVTAWALLQRTPTPTRQQLQDALAGNLCRCTGYEGILRALVADHENRGAADE